MKTTALGLTPPLLGRRATADPEYCSPHQKHHNRVPDSRLVPPLPCPGEYVAPRGICCAAKFDWTAERCHGANHVPVWAIPLAPCVTQNPRWSGCPGNIIDGLCCSGPDVIGERIERGEDHPPQCMG